jgi:hypothetical protein
MTIQQWQDELHTQYQGDTETPEDGDEDWTVRLNLLYDAIDAWRGYEGVLWLELWTTLTDAIDGDKTTNGVDVQFDCPADFQFPGGFVRVIDGTQYAFYSVVRPETLDLYRGGGESVCWFTGNARTGFKLNFLSAPPTGRTIDYPYYKTAFKPTTAAHILEMSDPYFSMKYVLAKLHELDGEGDRASLALQIASSKLQMMKTANQLPVWFQDNSIPDGDFATGTGGFGT